MFSHTPAHTRIDAPGMLTGTRGLACTQASMDAHVRAGTDARMLVRRNLAAFSACTAFGRLRLAARNGAGLQRTAHRIMPNAAPFMMRCAPSVASARSPSACLCCGFHMGQRGFAGTVFGELAALGLNTRRTMKVVCEEDAEVLILSSSDIKRIFEGRPEARLSLRLCAGGSCSRGMRGDCSREDPLEGHRTVSDGVLFLLQVSVVIAWVCCGSISHAAWSISMLSVTVASLVSCCMACLGARGHTREDEAGCDGKVRPERHAHAPRHARTPLHA